LYCCSTIDLMKKEEIHLQDLKRIFLGQAPPEFLLEVLIRTVIVYLFLLLAVRILGKRTSKELTITETAIILMLGAVVSVPMQVPDKGLLQGVLVLFCIVAFQRGLTLLNLRSPRMEKIAQGDLSLLVKDGILQLDVLHKSRITRQQVFAIVRSKKIYNLGKVRRLYLEACGTFSLYARGEGPAPGLPVYPPDDERILEDQRYATEHGAKACCNCGKVVENAEDTACTNCGASEWTKAII
jgi:uncharacterized membrane protein YcaP (DUF421 family)